ncbi:hypothetical protein RRSWK_05507 [Rhodopirellula sp. SWK7]|nr:hypothetical protein RRSWK_06621 [Rhodopirellula sp. SWK7]EMI41978.1 hypothetical protein RRSWK_05507 [Rhodopirellula sp. SWK7]
MPELMLDHELRDSDSSLRLFAATADELLTNNGSRRKPAPEVATEVPLRYNARIRLDQCPCE